MSGIRKFELVGVAQMNRPTKLESVGAEYLAELKDGEYLLIGLPEVLGPWEKCIPLILGAAHREQFLEWVRASTKSIEGPVYNLPALSAFFLCAILEETYDPRVDGFPTDATPELIGALTSLSSFMDAKDAKAA